VTLKELKDFLRNCEKEEAQAWRSLVNPPKRQSQHDDSSIVIDEIDQYRRRVTDVWRRISDDCEVLRSRVKTLEDEDLKTSKDKDVTNLGDKDTIGLSDWAKDSLRAYGTTLEITTNASVLGGSITFAAIVSANRGDISYMVYSFLMFMLGFAISITTRAPLTWYSNGRNIRIRNHRFWEGIITLIASGGLGCVSSAFILLAICVQTMDHKPNVLPWQSFSPLGAVFTGYAILGVIFVAWFLLFLKFFVWRMFPSQQQSEGLNDSA